MGFFITTLIFVVTGIIASLCARICCNKGPSANLIDNGIGMFHVQHKSGLLKYDRYGFVGANAERMKIAPNIGYYSDCLLLDDVGNRLSCAAESTDSSNSK